MLKGGNEMEIIVLYLLFIASLLFIGLGLFYFVRSAETLHGIDADEFQELLNHSLKRIERETLGEKL